MSEFKKAPRDYTQDEIDATWRAVQTFHKSAISPTFKLLTIRTWKELPEKRVAPISHQDVWFICRDVLRNKLHWVIWEEQKEYGYRQPNSAFRMTTLGREASAQNLSAVETLAIIAAELSEYESSSKE